MATKDISDKTVCEAYRDKGELCVFADELLHERTGQPMKVCYSAMDRAERHGLIEYGVSIRSGWLTPKGQAILDER